jgi:hypothetical protein
MNIKFPPPHKDLGAFFALRAKNRAFRSNSSVLHSQALRDFRYNPWRAHQRQTADLRITPKSAVFFAPQKKPLGVVSRLRRAGISIAKKYREAGEEKNNGNPKKLHLRLTRRRQSLRRTEHVARSAKSPWGAMGLEGCEAATASAPGPER